jgi:hypothetical protein
MADSSEKSKARDYDDSLACKTLYASIFRHSFLHQSNQTHNTNGSKRTLQADLYFKNTKTNLREFICNPNTRIKPFKQWSIDR